MSLISNQVYDQIRSIFPLNVIKKEHYVKFKGTKLFFDFFIKDLNVLIEVQGEQHSRFVKHFHNTRKGFLKSKHRDNFKVEYAQENGIALARIYHNEKITKDLIMKRIYAALEDIWVIFL